MLRNFKILSILLAFAFIYTSCEKQEEQIAPELPPYESMVIDFSKVTNTTKSASDGSILNYTTAGITVGVWNIVIGATMIVPTSAFFHSFAYNPEFIGDATWQWKYDIKVLGATYNARMTCKIQSSDVKWEMNISRDGIGAFDEFKWFEGTSALDGMSGQWTLMHSYHLQEEVLKIDWEKKNEEVASVTYTYVRESDNGDPNQLAKDSYLTYGLKDDVYDAYYNIHYISRNELDNGFWDVNIEWSTTEYFGRIKAPHYPWPANPDDWHCWNENGLDVVCSQ